MSTSIPSIWREELWHPLIVHFPLAFLTLAGAASLPCLFAIRQTFRATLTSLRFSMLALGAPLGWLALYTGDMAEGVVNRIICDPTITNKHEEYAEYSVYLFSAAALLSVSRKFIPIIANWGSKKMDLLESGLSIFAGGMLVYSAHLGASLVYQQGAGVYKPAPECLEFE